MTSGVWLRFPWKTYVLNVRFIRFLFVNFLLISPSFSHLVRDIAESTASIDRMIDYFQPLAGGGSGCRAAQPSVRRRMDPARWKRYSASEAHSRGYRKWEDREARSWRRQEVLATEAANGILFSSFSKGHSSFTRRTNERNKRINSGAIPDSDRSEGIIERPAKWLPDVSRRFEKSPKIRTGKPAVASTSPAARTRVGPRISLLSRSLDHRVDLPSSGLDYHLCDA